MSNQEDPRGSVLLEDPETDFTRKCVSRVEEKIQRLLEDETEQMHQQVKNATVLFAQNIQALVDLSVCGFSAQLENIAQERIVRLGSELQVLCDVLGEEIKLAYAKAAEQIPSPPTMSEAACQTDTPQIPSDPILVAPDKDITAIPLEEISHLSTTRLEETSHMEDGFTMARLEEIRHVEETFTSRSSSPETTITPDFVTPAGTPSNTPPANKRPGENEAQPMETQLTTNEPYMVNVADEGVGFLGTQNQSSVNVGETNPMIENNGSVSLLTGECISVAPVGPVKAPNSFPENTESAVTEVDWVVTEDTTTTETRDFAGMTTFTPKGKEKFQTNDSVFVGCRRQSLPAFSSMGVQIRRTSTRTTNELGTTNFDPIKTEENTLPQKSSSLDRDRLFTTPQKFALIDSVRINPQTPTTPTRATPQRFSGPNSLPTFSETRKFSLAMPIANSGQKTYEGTTYDSDSDGNFDLTSPDSDTELNMVGSHNRMGGHQLSRSESVPLSQNWGPGDDTTSGESATLDRAMQATLHILRSDGPPSSPMRRPQTSDDWRRRPTKTPFSEREDMQMVILEYNIRRMHEIENGKRKKRLSEEKLWRQAATYMQPRTWETLKGRWNKKVQPEKSAEIIYTILTRHPDDFPDIFPGLSSEQVINDYRRFIRDKSKENTQTPPSPSPMSDPLDGLCAKFSDLLGVSSQTQGSDAEIVSGETPAGSGTTTTRRGRPKQRFPIDDKIRQEAFAVVFGGDDAGVCPVCGNKKCHKWEAGGFHAAHIIPDFQLQRKPEAEDLVPACGGCNLACGKHHLFDFMGTYSTRRGNLLPLVDKLYRAHVPPSGRARYHGPGPEGYKQQLVNYVRERYRPPRLAEYETWLELKEDLQ